MELLKKIFKKKPRNTSMEILNKSFKEKPRNLWKYVDWDKYHTHATVSSIDSTTKSDDIDDRIIYMDEIEKRKEIFGICGECNEPGTGDPNTKDYMMVLNYCKYGNLRNYYLNNSNDCMKPCHLSRIANGLLSIHNAEKVHKDFHSGNILFSGSMFISDLGMCQPANNKEKPDKKEGVYGVLPYMAPEYLSEVIPFNDIPHDHILAVKICKGLRPKISEGIPKLFVDLIMKCWDAKAENRPTAKELYQVLKKWDKEGGINSEIYFQMNEYEKIRKHKLESKSSENMSESKKSHPQAIYTSRLLNFKNLPEPLNSSDLSLFQLNSDDVPSVSANPISECFDCKI
ncbi:uncharacterized protein OCT59_020281 [Rhizophagus irregularis]|uniref:uncharacterized protein n=1 Tax=Rhizophagus irregularis TaxID=588596 RepID=UPI0033166C03|nr:hypothetical protein OCT59_020281 [Rhizophagus irregularis]